jgi:hypothetical protein
MADCIPADSLMLMNQGRGHKPLNRMLKIQNTDVYKKLPFVVKIRGVFLDLKMKFDCVMHDILPSNVYN